MLTLCFDIGQLHITVYSLKETWKNNKIRWVIHPGITKGNIVSAGTLVPLVIFNCY